MLNIEHLTKTYGGKAAVQDLSLHIRPGEICAFIGHNGAGKTTTLKYCCGIQQFDSGRITVDGISVQDDPLECKRRLAYLPDNPDLYEYMTGIQYLSFIADIFSVLILDFRQQNALFAGLPQTVTADSRKAGKNAVYRLLVSFHPYLQFNYRMHEFHEVFRRIAGD